MLYANLFGMKQSSGCRCNKDFWNNDNDLNLFLWQEFYVRRNFSLLQEIQPFFKKFLSVKRQFFLMTIFVSDNNIIILVTRKFPLWQEISSCNRKWLIYQLIFRTKKIRWLSKYGPNLHLSPFQYLCGTRAVMKVMGSMLLKLNRKFF